MSTFPEALEVLKNATDTRIVIIRPGRARDLPIHGQVMDAIRDCGTVVMVDTNFLQSYVGMRRLTDVLVIPELDTLDVDDYRHVAEYVRAGGHIVMSANDLFSTGKTLQGTRMAAYAEERGELSYFRRTKAELGIKPYVSDVPPATLTIDTDFVAELPAQLLVVDVGRASVQINTTSDRRRPFEQWGTQFAQRYEVLRNHPVVQGFDPAGRNVSTVVDFAENWETGARLCIFTGHGAGTILDPDAPHFAPLLRSAVAFASQRIIGASCQPNYACYRQGETVRVTYDVASFDTEAREISVGLTILGDADEVVFTRNHRVDGGAHAIGQFEWEPESFATDFYRLELVVTDGGRVLSKVENGFVVWDPAVAENGPAFEADGSLFKVGGERKLVYGANYYESHQGSHMWVTPNVAKLSCDLAQMSSFGLNFIRVHYHHPKWFYDHFLDAEGFVPEAYRHLGEQVLPNERSLRIFDAHVYLCQKFGIVWGGDLFTLRPEEMGDARGWFGVQDYLWLEEALEVQKAFLDVLIPRYLDVPGISWDLYNEPMGVLDQEDEFYDNFNVWASKIREHIRSLGDRHTVTIGDNFSTGGFEPVSDYLAYHANFRWAGQLSRGSGKPELLQEVWMDRPPTPEGDVAQRQDLRSALIDTFRTGLAGFCPWQWTQQLGMWQSGASWGGENWDDYLGTCVRYDQTVKPGGRLFADFIELLRGVRILDLDSTNAIEAIAEQVPNGIGNTSGFSPDQSSTIDIPSGSIETDLGRVAFAQPASMRLGDHYVLLDAGDSVRGMARGHVDTLGHRLRADDETDLWFIFDRDGKDRVKADAAGLVELTTSRTPTSITTFDPLGEAESRAVEFTSVDGTTLIDVEPWHTHYWLEISY